MLLSKIQAKILQLMCDNGLREMYGSEIMKRSGGEIKLGTVHTTLRRMQDKGFLTSRQEDKPDDVSGIPRRLYLITSDGLQAFEKFKSAKDSKYVGDLVIN